MKFSFRITCSLLILVFFYPLFCQEAEISPEQIKAAEKLVRDVYRDKFRLRKADEIRGFIRELIDEGKKNKDSRAQQYVLFSEACSLAGKIGDVKLAIEAESELTALTGKPRLAEREEMLKSMYRRVRDTEGYLLLAETYLQIADEYDLQNDFDSADGALSKAYGFAKRAKNRDLYTGIAIRKKQNDYILKKFRYAAKAMAALAGNPDDGEENHTAGSFFCFVRGDWDKGLPYLTRSSEKSIADLAKKDIEMQKAEGDDALFAVNDIVKLAEGWLEAAEDERDEIMQGNMAVRAAMWFGKALPGMSSLAQKALEKKINRAEELSAGAGGAAVGAIPYGAVFVFTFNENSLYEQNGKTYIKEMMGNGPDFELTDGKIMIGKAGEGIFVDSGKDGTNFQPYKLDKEFGSPVTFSFWVKMNGWKELEKFRGYCPFGTGGATKISINSVGSILYAPSLKNDIHSEKGLVEQGKWTHIGIVVKGKDKESISKESVLFYINGKQTPSSGRFRGIHDSFRLGSTKFGNTNFNGMIDEFAVFERPLSEKEIKQLYVLGKSGKTLK